MTKSLREQNKKNRSKNLIDIEDFCSDYNIQKTFMTDYQVRIVKSGSIVDVYPTNKKYFIIFERGAKVGKWGEYDDIVELLGYFN